MQIGIDSYSYHRRYGELRAGESAGPEVWPLLPDPAIAHARSLGVDALFLETCYLPAPESLDGRLTASASPMRLGFSWGHPWPVGQFHGLDGGRQYGAELDLIRWIDAAARLGHPFLRITAGSPASRGNEPAEILVERLVGPMRRVADHAISRGVKLALENHGDLRAHDILDLFDRVDRPNLGVCLDNVNLIRVGDDMLEGAKALASLTLLVQLKDHGPGDPTIWGGPICLPLGKGIAPLDQTIAILDGVGFDGPVCVELASLGEGHVDELAMIAESVTWLRQHLPG
jgi:sugar phosphate isomerase/epimerase